MLTLLWFRRDLRLTRQFLPGGGDRPRPGSFRSSFSMIARRAIGLQVALALAARWIAPRARRKPAPARRRPDSVRRGPAELVINDLLRQTGADAVNWNRRYEPWATARDERLKANLRSRGLEVRSYNAA